jgi:hypothetical protein
MHYGHSLEDIVESLVDAYTGSLVGEDLMLMEWL